MTDASAPRLLRHGLSGTLNQRLKRLEQQIDTYALKTTKRMKMIIIIMVLMMIIIIKQ